MTEESTHLQMMNCGGWGGGEKSKKGGVPGTTSNVPYTECTRSGQLLGLTENVFPPL